MTHFAVALIVQIEGERVLRLIIRGGYVCYVHIMFICPLLWGQGLWICKVLHTRTVAPTRIMRRTRESQSCQNMFPNLVKRYFFWSSIAECQKCQDKRPLSSEQSEQMSSKWLHFSESPTAFLSECQSSAIIVVTSVRIYDSPCQNECKFGRYKTVSWYAKNNNKWHIFLILGEYSS